MMRSLLSTLLIPLLAACNSAGRAVEVEEVLNYHQCQTVHAGVNLVSMNQIAGIRGSRLLTLDPQTKDTGVAGQIATPSPTQPETVVLLAVSKGSKPSAGYGFSLDRATQQGDAVDLYLEWKEPEPGSLQAQVMTNPCIVVGVARGSYSKIITRDQNGIIGEVSVN